MTMHNFKILVINPGSTSTKYAIYSGKQLILKDNIKHSDEDLSKFSTIASQLDYRYKLLVESLSKNKVNINEMNAVVGRGGFLRPIPGGTYLVNNLMIKELTNAKYGEHASNLGAPLADRIAKLVGSIQAFIVDPIVVDEMSDLARISGIPDIERKSHAHALNIKSVARKISEQIGKNLKNLNFVIAHLGSGISVVAHQNGKMVDVNNANNEGPFSTERAGGLPSYQLIKLCYSGKYSEKELINRVIKEGGLYAYLGTRDILNLECEIKQGNKEIKNIVDAMIYQIAKEIGAMAAAMNGNVDGIILTGGLCYSNYITEQVTKKVSFIADLYYVPGEEELESLAKGVLDVLEGKSVYKKYI